jgi:phosphatidate phosphatase APP1
MSSDNTGLTGWRKILAEVGSTVEHAFDDLKTAAKQRFGYGEPIHVQIYHSYGTASRLHVIGRVLEREGPGQPEPDEPTWENFYRIYKAFESDEIPGAEIELTVAGQTQNVRSDREGYFDADFDGSFAPGEVEVNAKLIAPMPDEDVKQPTDFTGTAFVPDPGSKVIVISDVDDTVMHTEATSLLKAALNTLLANPYRRVAFPGVGAFYRALRDHGEAQQSFFYLTSSAWNVYEVMRLFFQVNDVPAGPILMRDLGLSPTKLLKGTHGDHKLNAVRDLMALYPEHRFVLIGDTGQHDAEIYRDVAKELHEQGQADRLAAVYLRDVSQPDRDAGVQKILDEIETYGVPAVSDHSSAAHAQHAAEAGLIDPAALDEIESEAARDRAEHEKEDAANA